MEQNENQAAQRGGTMAVTATDLSKQFGDELAVNKLNFTVPPGTIFGFIGPSGCGKTTTIRLLTGIYEPTSGTALVLGAHPRNFKSELRERIGYMPQHFVLYPDLSVMENLNFVASLYGIRWSQRSHLRDLLEFVDLDKHRNKIARNISGGMQRRLSLAATLVHSPELIFFDEPTAGIDPMLRRKIWDHFGNLKQQGRTLFVTTQYVGEAAYCDYVGVMANGRLLLVDTPAELRKRAFGGDVIDLQPRSQTERGVLYQISQLPFVRRINTLPNGSLRVIVDDASKALPLLLDWLGDQNIEVESAKEYLPPFDDVFVMLVQNVQGEEGVDETIG